MSDTQDPFASHLQRAQDLFQAGEVIAAGQIWQAVLRKNPTHAGARACLVHVKHWLDERQKAGDPVVLAVQNQGPVDLDDIASSGGAPRGATPPPPAPAPAPPPAPPPQPAPPVLSAPQPPPESVAPATVAPAEDIDIDLLIRQGCTLFDMDQVEDALARWEEILRVEPNHRLALEYVASARQELARRAAEPAHAPVVAEPTPAPMQELASEDTGEGILEGRLFSLLQEGLELYDKGNTDGAMARWREMLALDPDNEDARAYLSMAQKDTSAISHPDVGRATGSFSIKAPGKPLDADALEQKCRQGERLMRLGRLEQAEFAFEIVLSQEPQHERALRGLEQVKTLIAEKPPESEPEAGASRDSGVVMPPAAVTAPGKPARSGLALPRALTDLTRDYPWMTSKGVLGGVAGLVLVLVAAGFVLRQRRMDAKLASDRAAFASAALAQVSRGNEAPDLSEKPASIKTEAELVIGDDPVRAYHRAKEFLRLNPSDLSAAQLVDRARLALSEGTPRAATLADYQKHLTQGDLESAEADIDALLRLKPDDGDLMQRASRLYLILAQIQASRERWSEAKDALRKGRALNPTDPAWQGRLKLLEKIPAQPKDERPGWIAFLG
ncbi:MAG: tetratricopeptide repeat protein [Holophagaceae bacterium]|nr:tetratricopeptide repeat protein [Holophagaceae bacterium]